MPATPLWLASIEALLNRSILASAQAGELVRRLDGTCLQIDVLGVTRIRAASAGGRLALLAGDDTPADAVISGSVAALMQLLRGTPKRGPATIAAPAPAQVRGDAEVASGYRELLALARPDWEEELARVIGDLPARRVSQFAQQALTWARRARGTLGENIAEYLQEEGRDLVNRTELEEFLRGVDDLRDTAERIEARLMRLEQQLVGAS
jgi:ubiquinone biosynthesis protein UbiJ